MNKDCDDCENCRMYRQCFPIPKIYDPVTETWIKDPYFVEEEESDDINNN